MNFKYADRLRIIGQKLKTGQYITAILMGFTWTGVSGQNCFRYDISLYTLFCKYIKY